jgi:beta propeller repeat protein
MIIREEFMTKPISILLIPLVILAGIWPGGVALAAPGSPYTPEEFVIVAEDSTTPGSMDIYGDWVVYQPYDFGGGKAYEAVNVATGARLTHQGAYFSGQRSLAVWEDTVAWILGIGPAQIEVFNLTTGARKVVVETDNTIAALDYRDGVIVWLEYILAESRSEIRALDVADGTTYEVALGPEYKLSPRVWGDLVVWEQAQAAGQQRDIYGYHLSEGKAFPISANPWDEYSPVVYEDTVVWVDARSQAKTGTDIYARDLTQKDEIVVCAEPGNQDTPAIWGDLIVWTDARNAQGLSGVDIYGYDLAAGQEFAITRHIGRQNAPAIYEDLVVWQDWRDTPQVRYAPGAMYGARLLDKPLKEELPVTGVPESVDGLIEVVWPHSGQPGTNTDRVNIGAYLFSPQGTKREVPCGFDPPLELWVAENNRPAQKVATVTARSWNWSPATWHFNDVDVRAARDSGTRMYFFLRSDESLDFRTNIWAHAADARTFSPQQRPVRSAQAQVPDAVDAVIQIVWPHGDLPVDQATMVNSSANLFVHGTDASVPANWNPVVTLYRSLNNGVSEPVAVGEKRLVTQGSLVYPVWDFNDIDVSEARDPQNKYYFRLEVEGVETYPTIWAHGADARTYFPEADVPECRCNECP